MSEQQWAGLGILALVLAIVGWLMLRRQPRAIQAFAFALALVGLGYLATTPAPAEIAKSILGLVR